MPFVFVTRQFASFPFIVRSHALRRRTTHTRARAIIRLYYYQYCAFNNCRSRNIVFVTIVHILDAVTGDFQSIVSSNFVRRIVPITRAPLYYSIEVAKTRRRFRFGEINVRRGVPSTSNRPHSDYRVRYCF